MHNLNWVDYTLLAIFILSIVIGFARGFIREIISLIALFAAVVIATMFSSQLASMFTSSATVQNVVNQTSTATGYDAVQPVSFMAIGISFTILFLGTIIIGAIIGMILNLVFQAGILGIGNRLLGAVFGFVRGIIVNFIIIFLVQLSPLSSQEWWQQSQFVNMSQPAVEWLGKIVSPALANLKEKFGQTMQGVGSQFQEKTKSEKKEPK